MSTEWNVVVFDKPGADRSKVRPAHVAAIPASVNSGVVTSAGALYHDVEKTKFAGSALHIVANSREEVIEILKKDIYAKEGIWDLTTVIAHPMGVACRIAKQMPGVNL